MSDIRENNSDAQQAERRNAVILQPTQQGLLHFNRLLLVAFVALMLIIVMLGYLLFPANHILRDFEHQQMQVKQVDISKIPMNPVLTAEIDALKGQLVGLVSGSIESKLNILEASVRSGKVSVDDLNTIHAVKNDLQVLKTYSKTGAGRLIAIEQEPPPPPVSEVSNALLQEMSQLKNLIYVSIASCGLMLAAVAGIWLKARYRLGHQRPSLERQKKNLLGK